jgi:hypothetical protein
VGISPKDCARGFDHLWCKRIEPLYKAIPYAASQDQELYELLGLVDALRVGRVREQQLAADFLQQRLMGGQYE